MIIQAEGNSVANAVCVAKGLITIQRGLDNKGYKKLRVVTESSGDEGNYRITLNSGDIIEIHIIQHARCRAWVD